MYHSRHVQFVEDTFPFETIKDFSEPVSRASSTGTTEISSFPLTILHPLSPTSRPTLPSMHPPSCPQQINPIIPPPAHIDFNTPNINPTTTPPPNHIEPVAPNIPSSQDVAEPPSCHLRDGSSIHPMTTRSKSRIFKPKKVHFVSKHPLPESVEPTCVTQALKYPEWQQAMTDEFMALMRNGTWSLIPPQPHYNIIGNK